MIPMPETYLPYADIRRCGLQVTFEMVDVDAAETAETAVSDACEMAQIMQTHDRTEHPSCRYASLEQDYWRLDGSFLLPEQEKLPLQQTGWWSDRISGADGVFDTPPVLRFSWNADQSSVGFTVCFDDAGEQHAARFRLRAYDADDVLLKDVLVENAADRCELDAPVEHYRTVTLEFLQTHVPHRRVRVTEVIFGLIKRFTQENTVSATLDYSFSPLGESLPTNELTLTVDNSDAAWNMANPKGVYAYLQQSQPLDVSLTIGADTVYMGRFYFTTASAEDNAMTAKITANDRVYWLDSVKCRLGSTGTWTLAQAVRAILESTGMDIPFSIPEELGARVVRRALPKDGSCRDALRLLAQAARCTCRMDRNGVLTFFDALQLDTASGFLDLNRMEDPPRMTVASEINTVELTVPNEYEEDTEETVYTASDRREGEPVQTVEYENAAAADGSLAEWLLRFHKRRVSYAITERGDPAGELADVVSVSDSYGGRQDVLITRLKFNYDGGLSCETEGCGL